MALVQSAATQIGSSKAFDGRWVDESPLYTVKRSEVNGWGLYATRDLRSAATLFDGPSPLIALLDNDYISQLCSWCFEAREKIQRCSACHVPRYCSKNCQRQAWEFSHKRECDLFRTFKGQTLPLFIRAILQILARKSLNAFSSAEWAQVMGLAEHRADFSDAIETMDRVFVTGALMRDKYKIEISDEEIVAIARKIRTNSLTLLSSAVEGIGLWLCLPSSQLNHSCLPNTAFCFAGRKMRLVTSRKVTADEELTTSYVDIALPPSQRQARLLEDYRFTCQCSQCSATPQLTLGVPDLQNQSLTTEGEQKAFQACVDALDPLKGDLGSLGEARCLCVRQLSTYPTILHPVKQVRDSLILKLLEYQYYVPAFILLCERVFLADEIEFDDDKLFTKAHPNRIMHVWVLIKQCWFLNSIATESPGLEDEHGFEAWAARELGQYFKLSYMEICIYLMGGLTEDTDLVFGFGSRLSKEVRDLKRNIIHELNLDKLAVPSLKRQPLPDVFVNFSKDAWGWWTRWMKGKESRRVSDGSQELKDLKKLIGAV